MARVLRVLIVAGLLTVPIRAQEGDTASVQAREELEQVKGQLESLNETFVEVKNTVDALKKIKLSGYIQSQFQSANQAGIASFAGGNFPAATASRFSVRRSRLKVQYENDITLSQYVLQIDVTQSGVGLKDAYVSIRDPWMRFVGLTVGVFDRPFGFEISYSSGSRENPERTRMYQTLFPGERELGAKVEVLPGDVVVDGSWWSMLNFKGGFFNGTGPTANENDNRKDFIGRLGIQVPMEDVNLAIDAGVSTYQGSVRANSKKVWRTSSSSKAVAMDSALTNLGTNFDRAYYGADIQVYYDLPVLGGLSLRAEVIQGTQPGTSSANTVYTPTVNDTHLYLREFTGFYVNYIQNVGAKNQFIARYDVFDPNTKVSGTDIGATASAGLTAADIRYSTLGIGWVYHWDDNVKVTVYYDLVTNEKVSANAPTSLAAAKTDLKDNVLTVRTQFRF